MRRARVAVVRTKPASDRDDDHRLMIAHDQDVVDTLLECHDRIRTFSNLAIAAAERENASPAEVVDICSRVERYFRHAFPLHVEDEEASVLPRLRGRSTAIDGALARMHDQHDVHGQVLGRLLTQTAALRLAPTDLLARARLLAVARPLATMIDEHLEAEETILLPAIRARLTTDERKSIVREMRMRRGSH